MTLSCFDPLHQDLQHGHWEVIPAGQVWPNGSKEKEGDHSRRGSTRRTADIQDRHKYLGIPQANKKHDEDAQGSATANYRQKVRQVLRSWLNGMNTIQAISTYALPVIRYLDGIVSWAQKDIDATGVKK